MPKKLNRLLSTLLLCVAVVGTFSGTLSAADAEAYLLLNVKSDGVLSVRDLVFTKVDSGEEVRIRDMLNLGRAGSPKYVMESLGAGEYFLSSIYPNINVRDTATRIDLDESDGVITILPGTINYIGDFVFTSRERGSGVTSSFNYEPNSGTLIAAVTAERELFESLDVVVSIAGNAPVPVDKKLLGL